MISGSLQTLRMAEEQKDPESGRPLMEKGKVAYVADSDAVEVAGESQKFIGLTKDELEEYRSMPFWRNLRYLLFGLFWLAWIAMFAAAIAIVVTSPPCKPKLTPHWWQMKIAYQVHTPSFSDSDGDGVGDVAGIGERIVSFKRLNAQTIWPRPLLHSKDGSIDVSDVKDWNAVDPKYGSVSDLEALITKAHSNGMYFIMDIPLVTSTQHDWFLRSAKKEAGYEDLYRWAPRSGASGFWTQDRTRREFFHHVEGKPDQAALNLDSPNAKAKFTEMMHSWLDRGVDGIYLENLEYAGRSPDGGSADWGKVYPILAEMDEELHTYENNTGKADNQLILFSGVNADVSDDVRAKLVTEGKLAYVYAPVLTSLNWEGCGKKVACIRNALDKSVQHQKMYKDTWPLYEVGNSKVDRLATRFGEERATLLEMLLLTLPGAISHYYGDELPLSNLNQTKGPYQPQHGVMQWSGEANAGFSSAASSSLPDPTADFATNNLDAKGTGNTLVKLFTRLAGLRHSEQTLMDGDFEVVKTTSESGNDGALVTIRRPKKGAKGKVFVTVLNFLDKGFSGMDLTTAGLEKTGEVVAATAKAAGLYTARSKHQLDAVTLPAFSGVVFRYMEPEPEPTTPAPTEPTKN